MQRATALRRMIAERERDRLPVGEFQLTLARIEATLAVATATAPKHTPAPAAPTVDALTFRAKLIAAARRRDHPVCERCLEAWDVGEAPIKIHNDEGDELYIHGSCVANSDEIV